MRVELAVVAIYFHRHQVNDRVVKNYLKSPSGFPACTISLQ